MLRALILILLGTSATAETVISSRIIRAGATIVADDIALSDKPVAGAFSDVAGVIGKEARIMIYPGRPIRPEQVGRPTLVRRNSLVTLEARSGGLTIFTEGRALESGGVGDTIKVLNQSSRTSIMGLINPDGTIQVAF